VLTTIADLRNRARSGPPHVLAVACAHDEDVLLAVDRAARDGLVRPVLVGRAASIESLAGQHGLELPGAEVVDCPADGDAAERAVRLVSSGRAQMLMKGLVATSVLLRAVLNKEWGLRLRPLLSHVAVFEGRDPARLVLVTDVAMNIAPDLGQKVQIVENAVALAHRLGIACPKVAPIASVETVNPEMPATVDAALLAKMADRGQIRGCVIDGPLALDNALSAEAARHKGIVSPVAGCADVLLMPGIDAGNVFYKSLAQLTAIPMAAIIVGARAPVVLTSRADSDETKFHSIALAAAVS
jgi:phosphate butyryltransferase